MQYALESTFHKQKRYGYQEEFRITVINNRKEAIEDLFIPVSEQDFSVVEPQKGYGLKIEIHVVPDLIEENIVKACIEIKFSLEKETKHEASI